MIDPKELRIFNWIEYEGKPNKVLAIHSPAPHKNPALDGKCMIEINPPDSFFVPVDDISPIPLTEEWLTRFGFEKATDAIGGYWSPSFDTNTVGLRWEFGEHIDTFRDIYWSYCVSGTYNVKAKYVHQLQNAIFVLLGKELELKP